jgi:hypothetical protein
MHAPRPFHIAFLTSFSDSSHKALPAVAQFAGELDAHITLLHAFDAERSTVRETENLLAGFFPDAGTRQTFSRITSEGDLVDAVNRLARTEPVDLLVAPSSDSIGWPRPFRSSLRSRLLRECGIPLWTMGPAIYDGTLNRLPRNVGCWVDLDAFSTAHITAAVEFAARLDARLHLLHAVTEIDEGSLTLPLTSDRPLTAEGANREVRALLGWAPNRPGVHSAIGSIRRVLPRLAAELNLDAVFMSREQALHRPWMSQRLSPAIDRCPCPVICWPPSAQSWRLRRGRVFASQFDSPCAA